VITQLIAESEDASVYPSSILTAFAAKVAAQPDAIAIQAGKTDQCWTYRELECASRRFAAALLRAGVTRGSLVGVAAGRSFEMVAALLGILQSGAAYVPLDLTNPPERTAAILADTQLSVLILDQDLGLELKSLLSESVTVISTTVARETTPVAEFNVSLSPDDLAYVMYTSGSTGTPKGVMIPHRGILRLVCQPDYVSISPDDVFLQLAPPSFDAATFEIWGALLNGARLVLAPNEKLTLQETAAAIKDSRASILWLAAGLFHALVDEYPTCLRNLKYLLAGGDVLSPVHVRRALAELSHGSLINGYGPTENTTFTCCHKVQFADTEASSIPIGRAINRTQVYVLDADRNPVAPGEVGELFAGGEGVALGYWNRPDLTKQSFLPNTFKNDGSLLYRTGDLVCENVAGSLQFVGRLDTQVKVRGFRVELGEVEAAARSHPQVSDAAVVLRDLPIGSQSLLCCYVARETALSPEALETFLSNKLPGYMVPGEYLPLPALPLNSNGKVDRQLLARQKPATPAPSASHRVQETPIESELLALLRPLLGQPDIQPDDDFFRMGGNSLVAARLFAQIDKRFGKRLPLVTILQARSVRKLAALLHANDENWRMAWSSCVPLKTSGTLEPFFIVHALGGNVVGYQELASHLPFDQPVYALQAKGLDGKSSIAHSVEEMAAHYVNAMRTIQPEGPYYLGGWSAGGRVAYEMACQLAAAGQKVAIVVIFDASIERSKGSAPQRLVRLARWNLYSLRQSGLSAYARKKIWNLRKHVKIASYDVRRRFSKPKGDPPEMWLTVQDAFLRALRHYRPGTYGGDVCVFRTRDAQYFSPGDEGLGWPDIVTGEIGFRDVPGSHDTIFQPPHLTTVSDELADVLRMARAKHAESSASPRKLLSLTAHGDKSRTSV
jgi:amino acid adenylation domain-containing protein